MRLSWLFARRYLFSRKSHSVINIISAVSALAIGVPVAAMIILLSVFNGFEGLVKSMYNDFDPDVAVSLREGKVFRIDGFDSAKLSAVEGVESFSFVFEDNALVEYRGRQFIARIRAVDGNYARVSPIEKMVYEGEFEPWWGENPQALVGQGVAYNLGVRTALLDPLNIIVPRRGVFDPLIPVDAFRIGQVYPSGTFVLDADTDGKYIIVPIEILQNIYEYENGATTVAVKIAEGYDPDKTALRIAEQMGSEYKALTRYQQKADLYRIMTYEKWGIFLITFLVMIIASFSLIGSIIMLIIDKKEDIYSVRSMGGDTGFIRQIFVRVGILISLTGGLGGMTLGLVICWIQQVFGIITIPAETFLIQSYPVIVKGADVLVVAAALTVVCYIIIKFTVSRSVKKGGTIL